MDTQFPTCLKCEQGVLVPLSVGKEIRESWK